ncbi:deoxyribodipyrimidine photo-lyase [Marinovum sp. 2_MG-2023]|uniref:cryptochrome/photolyase family protein n=1 Tax=unclassified Marinovum TaxID=2647166 RepID=UPI0026E42908|nr:MULTISPECIES: deoxyribodipyrimidine photo-lyase [unclassified Marinovum]MDO6729571.1 deoxyribodipyrimidine photo-lyase [Marinovum sp. 2_MG-2023]MDO6780275.1 deoxyribodipyrimidine photo-lyase [Marinovum sp. 1_MG-2023]
MTTILWFRRDLRLSDHAALTAACAAGPVVAVFIRDATVDQLGAAPAWRLGLALEHLAQALAARGQRLILRSGRAEQVLAELVAEVDAKRIYWTRCYDPQSRERDTEIKSRFRAKGIDVRSFGGTVLFEPTTVETKTGGPYKVFSPYWKTVKTRDVDAPLPEPGKIPPPETWPESANLADWALGARMRRGADVVRAYLHPGETAAQNRLAEFAGDSIALYHQRRDLPAVDGTSGLSEYLTYGEISPHQCWHAGLRAREEHSQGAEAFLRELAWRDFATHLMVHWPDMLDSNWRAGWDNFAWREDESLPEVIAWQQARTGVPLVDAGLREMYVTGRMHNRVRMVVASYLTKHMLVHWRIGQRWFGECLTDWDAASNAMGWQWVAGSGPDAAPYFRVFNPESQAKKFDPKGAYVRRWIAEGQANPPATARAYFDAIPRSWNITPGDLYPAPVVGLDAGRKRALLAYENRGF